MHAYICTRPPTCTSCSHLLCKHTGSRNPISRRTGERVVLSKAEAEAELRSIIAAGLSWEDFGERAAARSDCGSFKKSGDLGQFSRGTMQKRFEEKDGKTPIPNPDPFEPNAFFDPRDLS